MSFVPFDGNLFMHVHWNFKSSVDSFSCYVMLTSISYGVMPKACQLLLPQLTVLGCYVMLLAIACNTMLDFLFICYNSICQPLGMSRIVALFILYSLLFLVVALFLWCSFDCLWLFLCSYGVLLLFVVNLRLVVMSNLVLNSCLTLVFVVSYCLCWLSNLVLHSWLLKVH